MSSRKTPLHLFEGFGVELEYMIVDQDSLEVKPITDKLIYDEVGEYLSDVEFGDIAWSNELVLHVVELKTQGPVAKLAGLQWKMLEHVRKINQMLEKYNAMLLPTGAHPLMNPDTDTKLWPHEYNAVYEAYNKIFDCRGHGWANLQSTHLNLPFANDKEFEKLHAAIRVLLPIIPALSASSPILDGKLSGLDDTRLEVYRHNQDRIPLIAGKVIPEQAFSKKAYEDKILKPIYQAIKPYDEEGVLQDEFLNSRGAIARFQRNAIEIRLIDIQESPVADMAIAQAVVSVLQALVAERWVSIADLKTWDENRLAAILEDVIAKGQQAVITNMEFIDLFGFKCTENCTVGELWKHLAKETIMLDDQPEIAYALHVILSRGNLSRRISEAAGENPSEERIKEVYQNLAICLQNGGVFLPEKPC
ncbi:carboxylate-amine ligase [Pontibacter cellulosilyticus]|uniref:Glutamate--cysteine ligase n=1 Tax=Pontibacter cellulosilyticus TaxID=1720253 RepID=A0A923N3P9_9BACT|nr:glutamate-cysteine ligase family protein [Pontibacter cellulosilyticus]MBC5991671.1 glutamate--cysteine ligase [Pontibacter cellulosilyticus]